MQDPPARGSRWSQGLSSSASRKSRGWVAGLRRPGRAFRQLEYLTPPEAVYPEEAITSHRAFIARRRELRPGEEYRAPTSEEWDEFLGHFERRKLALGDCGRAWGTSCIHEHSCIRCPLLSIDPAQQQRLHGIRDNLTARIAEAGQQGWAGEAEGLKVSLAAANNKLAQIEITAARRTQAVSVGMPAYRDAAASTITALHGPDSSEGNP